MSASINKTQKIEVTQAASKQTSDTDQKTIRLNVLATIRESMPIDTLFRPELKINLNTFISDQVLFHQLAQFLNSLSPTSQKSEIKQAFEQHASFPDFQNLFKQNQETYLNLFYEACGDVLAGKDSKDSSDSVKEAIIGRIFTLKNALVAQHSPQSIIKSQRKNASPVQNDDTIQNEGASFIRKCLQIQLKALKNTTRPSFRATLLRVATQLAPFTEIITRSYLEENKIKCPQENLLTYKDQTGYNKHGYAAATVMDTALKTLGYQSRAMVRRDLEPRATTGMHSIIEITSLDGDKYLVDPTYRQFFKDVQLNDDVPKEEVLVLKEDEEGEYVEKNLMSKWKTNFARAKQDQKIITLMRDRNLLSYFIHVIPYPEELVIKNHEQWARDAFTRPWQLSNYDSINKNYGYQEIFQGIRDNKTTHNLIKPMAIPLSPTSDLTQSELCTGQKMI